MKCYLIRHAATKGNLEHRYVGRTEESVLPQELHRLRRLGESLSSVEYVFTSPSLRCRQSAEALFQDRGLFPAVEIISGFQEMDFGQFEYKNYQELNGNPEYQDYIDSGGKIAFPGGEAPKAFQMRCKNAFVSCIKKAKGQQRQSIAFVVHGGTIMAVMEAFGNPPKGYFDYQVKNGCGYLAVAEEKPILQLVHIQQIGL